MDRHFCNLRNTFFSIMKMVDNEVSVQQLDIFNSSIELIAVKKGVFDLKRVR